MNDVELAGLGKWGKRALKKVGKVVTYPVKVVKKNPVVAAVAGAVFLPGLIGGASTKLGATKIGGTVVKSATAIGKVALPAVSGAAGGMATAYVSQLVTGKKEVMVANDAGQMITWGDAIQSQDDTVESVQNLSPQEVQTALAQGGTIIKEVSPTKAPGKPFTITPTMMLIGSGALVGLIGFAWLSKKK